MNLFDLLAGCLSDGERLRFDLDRDGDALTVVVQPLLKSAPPHLDADRQRLRAALAHPLYLRGTSEQFAEGLADALAEYGAKRRDLHAVAADLDVLDEALRQARQAAHAQRQRVAQAGKNALPAGAKPAADDAVATRPALPPARNPDSLF
jgi:PRTRC genetic system protein E